MAFDIKRVKNYFESQNIILSDAWLESCIQWCIEEALPRNFTPADLHSQIYEQWLLLDLREVNVAVLPPRISSINYQMLSGSYCLQLMEVTDISKPKLQQLQNIRNKYALTKSITEEEVSTGKRMLQLLLTDGVQDVNAIEYRPIRALKLNFAPGMKLKIIGPVKVRRGQLMLEEHNIKILGGEVEELVVSHAAENVLARKLNLPLNQNPLKLDEVTPESFHGKNTPSDNTNMQIRVKSTYNINQQPTVMSHNQGTIAQNVNSRPRQLDMMDDEINLLLEAEEDFLRESNFRQNSIPQSSNTNPRSDLSLDDDDDDVFSSIDIDAHLDQVEEKMVKNTEIASTSNKNIIKTSTPASKPNVITIAKLLQNKKTICKGRFKIRAKFKEVVEKVDMDEKEYKVKIQIEDESASMVVKVHTSLMADFAGYEPAALISLKAGFLEKEPVAVRKVVKALKNIKEKLIQLNGVMEVLVVKEDPFCTIMKLL